MKTVIPIILCWLLSTAVVAAQNSDISFKVGGVSLIFNSPISEMKETGYDIRERLEVFTPQGNRLIAGFLTLGDFERINSGLEPEMNFYGMIQVIRQLEFYDVTIQDFNDFYDMMKTEWAEMMSSSSLKGEVQADLNKTAEILDIGEMSLGDIKNLGEFFRKEKSFAFGSLMSIESGGEKSLLVCGASVLNLKQRLILVYLYKSYINNNTITEVKKSLEDWCDLIIRENI